MRPPPSLLSCGATTSVGRDARSSSAALRGGISGFTEHPYIVDAAGAPIVVSIAPWLDVDMDASLRFEALLIPALEQALEPLADVASSSVRVALVLALPSPRPGLPGGLERTLRTAIEANCAGAFAAIGVFPADHAAGFLGLDAAWPRMGDGDFDACVIAGVESYITADTLEWLEKHERVHGAGLRPNSWGFIPGEGAGAVLMATPRLADRLNREPMASALGVGLGFEPNRIETPTVCVGKGLTGAIRSAVQSLPTYAKVDAVFADSDGGPYRSDEYGFAILRTVESFASEFVCVTPADCLGDVGAASASLLMAMATLAGAAGGRSGGLSLAFCSSNEGQRGAAILATRGWTV